MKVKSLEIKRTESYQTPANQLVGVVEFVSEEQGKLSVTLSPTQIADIFDLLLRGTPQRAKELAAGVAAGIDDAKSETKLLVSAAAEA